MAEATLKLPAGPVPVMRWREAAIPLAVLGIVLAMIVPLPALVVDLLISANISISVVVLMVAMYIRRPSEFSLFPTTLLLLTLFRLALNVSSSRLILMNGNRGTAAAGGVIEAFGNFVVGGNFVIGLVIFLVLIAIQYVVINHGAVRISEVTARFTLDALPGKQMSIDSDLSAGLIDETEAKQRRKQLTQEAEFYGSMDGASRFTQRDAVASILITLINIVAGFLIGVLQLDMELVRALKTYTVLTIGDGLVTVIPALMVSVSGGLIVTRATGELELGEQFEQQLLSNAQPLWLASGILLAMAAFPGLPKIPFIALGSGLGAIAWKLRQKTVAAEDLAARPASSAAPAKENVEQLLKVEPLAVEVGLGLVRLVEGGANSPLLRRIGGIRRQLASDLGYLLPPVRVTDNLSLRSREYVVLLKGTEIARFELPAGMDLAIASGLARGGQAGKEDAAVPAPPGGAPTRDPAFGMAAWWIPTAQAEAARGAGFTVVDAVSVMGTHLGELIRRYAHELFSRQDVKALLDRVTVDNPKAVEDLVPKLLPMSSVQKVLQNLLRERVSIRDASSILEALSEAANATRNMVLLTEYVRQTLRRSVVKPYLTPKNELPAWMLELATEQMLESAVEHGEQNSHLSLPPARIRELLEKLTRVVPSPDVPVIVLVSAQIRFFLRQMTEALPGQFVFLSHAEIPSGVNVITLGTL
jgi:flagellar biosynthesis protein FlhA